MPLINGYVNNLNDDLKNALEKEITESVVNTLAEAFPLRLGFAQSSKEYEIAEEVVRSIAPAWVWVELFPFEPKIAGKEVEDGYAAKVDIGLLERALGETHQDAIVNAVADSVRRVLSRDGSLVQLAVSNLTGNVRMSVPGSSDALLNAEGVHQFLLGEILKALNNTEMN